MNMEALILTKSAMKKNGNKGACVTAHDLTNNRFVRFVADANGSPIPYHVSNQFDLFDYVSVRVIAPCPMEPQTENWLVDVNTFQVERKYLPAETIDRVYRMVQTPSAPRFMDKQGNKLRFVNAYNHSLELIRVSELRIVRVERNDSGKVTGKAEFQYHSSLCDSFSVTDPKFDIRKRNQSDWEIGEAYIMVSIPTEPYDNGYYYKFIAAIYPVHEFPF